MVLMMVASAIMSQWSPMHLDDELYPIAHIESSFGKNINHKPNPRGEEWSAYGALGLKPVSAFDTYRHVWWFNARYPNLKMEEIVGKLQTDPIFYIDACNAHWHYLRATFPSMSVAIYAWRWGVSAAKQATWESIAYDEYVLAYKAISGMDT